MDKAQFCTNCGASATSENTCCSACGTRLNEDSKVTPPACPHGVLEAVRLQRAPFPPWPLDGRDGEE